MIIDNIEQIEHPQLVKDIKSLCLELTSHIVKTGFELPAHHSLDRLAYSQIIQHHILGVDRPMCICDGAIYSIGDGEFTVELLVNYQVMYGYKPNQESFTDIHLFYKINKEILRDHKIDELCHI